MNDTEYRVKCSKKLILFVSIAWGIIGGTIFIALIILSVKGVVSAKDTNEINISGDIFGLCFSIICLVFVICAVIYPIWKYKCVVDIYQKDKVIRMNGKRQKYVLYYNNIISIKQGAIGTLYFVCRDPILIYGKRKGAKTIIEHYRKEDIYRIKQIIGNSNYNLIIN